MRKLVYILFFGILFTSCDPDSIIYDSVGGQSIASFNATVQTLPVSDSGESVAEVLVGVSTITTSDRTISVSIDAASTAAAAEYTIDPASLVIPAGEAAARIRVIGNFSEIPETGTTNVVLNLDSVEGARLDGDRLAHRVNLFRFCPFENGSTFLGDYRLEVISTGLLNVDTFTPDQVVTLTEGSTVADRVFSATLYPAFGGFGPFQFGFSLICDDVVVPSEVSTGLACGAGAPIITVGGPSTNASYMSTDDSEFTINFTDDILSSCGDPVEFSIRLVKL